MQRLLSLKVRDFQANLQHDASARSKLIQVGSKETSQKTGKHRKMHRELLWQDLDNLLEGHSTLSHFCQMFRFHSFSYIYFSVSNRVKTKSYYLHKSLHIYLDSSSDLL